MTPPNILLLTFLGIVVAAAAFFAVMSRRWRLRNGRPPWSALIGEPELSGFGGPFSPVRREANRMVSRGTAAESPEAAYVARLIARQRIRQFENPWSQALWALILLIQVPGAANAFLDTDSSSRTLLYGAATAVMLLVFTVGPFHVRRTLRRARRALEANEHRAAAHEAEREREEARARAEHERAEAAAVTAYEEDLATRSTEAAAGKRGEGS